MLVYFFGLCLAVSSTQPAIDRSPRDFVWSLLDDIEHQRWHEAEKRFTNDARITGVPAEAPEKRWTKSAAAFLAEKPNWCFHILDSKLSQHDRTATLLVDFRHAHLVCRSTFDLVKIGNDWKVDAMRFATRSDAPGAAEQMKKLKGTWHYAPDKDRKEVSLLREVTLQLDQDEFKLEMTIAQINLFGSNPPSDKTEEHRGWQVRLYPKANVWMMGIQWETGITTEGLLAQFSREGDKLILQPNYLGLFRNDSGVPGEKMVFERR